MNMSMFLEVDGSEFTRKCSHKGIIKNILQQDYKKTTLPYLYES